MRACLVALLAAFVAVCAAAAAPARAAGLEIGIEDERLSLTYPANLVQDAAAWRAAGVQRVRIQARWWEIAPGRNSRRPPAGFRQADPNDPRYDWSTLDNAVAVVRATGMKVMLTVTGPGPLWTSRVHSRHYRQWDPDPAAFGRFARAVALRYRSAVDRYLIWNEPNQPGWLMPQWSCKRHGGCTAVAAHEYRGLVRAAEPAIHRADPGSQVLLGELAPIGRNPHSGLTPEKPLPFLRDFACVDSRYRPVRTGRCRHFRPAGADAFGYHPHTKGKAPDWRNPDPDEAQYGDFGRLFAALDRLTRARRILAPHRRFPVYLTEFGYQTNPPSSGGVSLAQQSAFLQEAAYIAAQQRRIKGLTFYQWVDEPPVRLPSGRNLATWQAGFFFVDGRPKPSLSTFPAPFVIARDKHGSMAHFWGQVRPDALHRVTLLIRPRGARSFRTLRTIATNGQGYWSRRLRIQRGAQYRFSWYPVGRSAGGPAPGAAGVPPAPAMSGVANPSPPRGDGLYAGAPMR